MRTRIATVCLAIMLFGTASTGPAHPGASAVAERVRPNDNLVAAAVVRSGVFTLRLEARVADWHPDGDDAPGAPMAAFAEEGPPAQIPGPLVRVIALTMPIHVTASGGGAR
jgi:hypothetical protein